MYVVLALLANFFYAVQTRSARPSFVLYSSYRDGTHFIMSVVFFRSSVEIVKSPAYSSVVQHLLQCSALLFRTGSHRDFKSGVMLLY